MTDAEALNATINDQRITRAEITCEEHHMLIATGRYNEWIHVETDAPCDSAPDVDDARERITELLADGRWVRATIVALGLAAATEGVTVDDDTVIDAAVIEVHSLSES